MYKLKSAAAIHESIYLDEADRATKQLFLDDRFELDSLTDTKHEEGFSWFTESCCNEMREDYFFVKFNNLLSVESKGIN